MKILIYSFNYLPRIGGMEISASLMRKHLISQGHDVTVITQTESPYSDGTGVIRKPKLGKLIAMFLSADLVVVRGALSLRATLPAVLTRTPFVVFHECGGSYMDHGANNFWLRIVRRFCASRSVLHIGVSQSIISELCLPGQAKTTVLYNPIHHSHQNATPLPLSQRDIDVLYVGKMFQSKGIFCLPPAIKYAGNVTGKRLKVGLVGEGEAKELLQRVTSTDQSNEWVFIGSLDQDRLAKFYGRAKVVVVPSTTREGMGMVAAEALFHGTPVLAARQPALEETIGSGGICVDPENAVEFGEAIADLLLDHDRWEEFSRVARIASLRFTDDHYRAALRNLLRLTGIEKVPN